MKAVIIFTVTLMFLWTQFAQGQQNYSLDEYLEQISSVGYDAKIAQTRREKAEAGFSFFRSQLRPQVNISAGLPGFTRTSVPVTQPDGTIAFQPVFQNNSSFSLRVENPVVLTGGTLFVESALQRFDNFGQRSVFYNGIPLRFGYSQSLLGFNTWKWNQKIESITLENEKNIYNFEVENIRFAGVILYFDALMAKTESSVADTNRTSNQKLLAIAEERYLLGKISTEEKLQMEAEYKMSDLQYRQALNNYHQSLLEMEKGFSSEIDPTFNLLLPSSFIVENVNTSDLIEEAIKNAPTIKQYLLDAENAKRNQKRTRAEWGPSLQVYASVGLAQSGNQVGDVYKNPFNEQQIFAGISIPVVDWGRKKAAVTMADADIFQATLWVEKEKQQISNTIQQLVSNLKEVQQRVIQQKEIVKISEARYNISKERYIAGVVPVNELFMAQSAKDLAIRNYLNGLRNLYVSYHDLLRLTGTNITRQFIQ